MGIQDLETAKYLLSTRKPLPIGIVCYLSQQATEKALKSILYNQYKEVPFHHKILDLLDLVNQEDDIISLDEKDALRMTRFAIRVRYYDNRLDVTEKDAEYAVNKASSVVKQVQIFLDNCNCQSDESPTPPSPLP